MFARLIVIPIFLLLTHCVEPPPPVSQPTVIQKGITLPNFTHVAILGAVNVQLHTGCKPKIVLRGAPEDVAKVQIGGGGRLLRVMFRGAPAPFGIHLDIYVPTLKGFSYKGVGRIRGEHLNTDALNLSLDNKGTTVLKGHIGLHRLKVKDGRLTRIEDVYSQHLMVQFIDKPRVILSGDVNLAYLNMQNGGIFYLKGVRSNRLKIRAGDNAIIALAGRATRLDIELWGKACFKGRYFRALDTFVKTHNHARASIVTLQRQHALALDDSDIYFYKIPMINASFMGDNGAVLDMIEWRRYLVGEDYSLYNKQGVHP
jgi:hypothetical protein